MGKIRIGVLACSRIAVRSVIPLLMQSERFELVCIAARDAVSAKSKLAAIDIPICSYGELVDSSEVDAVYVSCPTGLHYDWAKRLLFAGKHILVEKTFTDSLEKAKDLIEEGVRLNLVVMEGLVYVFNPQYKKILSLVNEGAIGQIAGIEAHFGFPHLSTGDIRYSFELGGGATLDTFVYPLSFSLNLMERAPIDVHLSVFHSKAYGVDLKGYVQLDWEGCSAQISYGIGLMYRNSVTLWGEKGLLSAERIFSLPPALPGRIRLQTQNSVEEIEVDAANNFSLMLDSFADRISGKDNSGINGSDEILARMKIIDLMRQKDLEQKGTLNAAMD